MDATAHDFIPNLPADTRDLDDLFVRDTTGQVIEEIQDRTPQNDSAAQVTLAQDCAVTEAAKVLGLVKKQFSESCSKAHRL
jgi:hypothetical protein